MEKNMCWISFMVDQDFCTAGSNGPRRSIVRRIGSWLPLRPVKCLHVHKEFIQKLQRSNSGISSSSEHDHLWCAPEPVTFVDVLHLINIKPQNNIRHRCEPLLVSNLVSCLPCEGSGLELNSHVPHTCVNEVATKRILELETELAKVRHQLAVIVKLQEQVSGETNLAVNCSSLLLGKTSSPVSLEVASSDIVNLSSVTCCVPPPPPPPMPPPACTPVTSIAALIQKNKARRLITPSSVGQKNINMTEVLKDMGKVKLRQVARSPGGTPLKRKPKESDDQATIIANALKRKFSKLIEHSPELTAALSPDRWSPLKEQHPRVPGPHLLKAVTSTEAIAKCKGAKTLQ